MKTVATLNRIKKEEQIYTIFEQLFNEMNEPISVKMFIEKAYDRFKDIYSKHMMSSVFARMNQRGLIQRVYCKKGVSMGRLFVPGGIVIPYEERYWETILEKKEREKEALKKTEPLKEEDYLFYLYMIAHPNIKKEYRKKNMPINQSLRKKDEEYKRFVKIIHPYLPLLEERIRFIITHRLGIEKGETKSLKEIGSKYHVGYSQTLELFSSGLYQLAKLMKVKVKG